MLAELRGAPQHRGVATFEISNCGVPPERVGSGKEGHSVSTDARRPADKLPLLAGRQWLGDPPPLPGTRDLQA
jgi:hypothetical protein